MVIFMDTFSLLKHYVKEEGSDQADRFFVENNTIWISPITSLEFHSALNRKLNEGSIDQDTHQKATDYWKQDQGSFTIVEFNTRLIEKALDIIRLHGTKTLDSVQIGSAIISNGETWVTSDKRMHDVMKTLEQKSTVLI